MLLADKLDHIEKSYPGFKGRITNALASSFEELENFYGIRLDANDFAEILSWSVGQDSKKYLTHFENDFSSEYDIKEAFKKMFDFTVKIRAKLR